MAMSRQDIGKLRKKAEELHKLTDSGKQLSAFEGDALKLLQELEIYQIELELSNQELQTARNKAEKLSEKYTALYDFAPMAYMTLDRKGEIQELNLCASQIFDQSRSVLLGRSFRTLTHVDYRTEYDEFLKRISESDIKEVCELIVLTKNLQSSGNFIVEGIKSQNKEEYLIALLDISMQKTLETQLIEAKEKAEENNRLKSIFLSNMAHEIRTPMNAIVGFSGLLGQKDISSGKREEFIQHIHFAGKRLLRLMSDILDICKIESDKLSIVNEPCNINHLFDETLSQFDGRETKADIVLSLKKGLTDKESTIMTDGQRVSQVLTNLIENALKYTSEGTIEFGYSLTAGELQFYVRDSGIGISHKNQRQIFERFSQVKNGEISSHTGVGLGLSIAQGIVHTLKGRLWVVSDLGKGSTFYFTLPYIPVELAPVSQALDRMNDLSGITVLVVEDSQVNQFYFKTVLKRAKCNVLCANNGKQAVAQVTTDDRIDIVLMDINMPVMDGFEAAALIKQYNRDMPIIAQTGEALDSDSDDQRLNHFETIMFKPILEKEMLSLIDRYAIRRKKPD